MNSTFDRMQAEYDAMEPEWYDEEETEEYSEEMAEAFSEWEREDLEFENSIEWLYCTVEGRWRNMEWLDGKWICDGCEVK